MIAEGIERDLFETRKKKDADWRVNKAMCTSLVATLLHVYDDTILATKIFMSE